LKNLKAKNDYFMLINLWWSNQKVNRATYSTSWWQ